MVAPAGAPGAAVIVWGARPTHKAGPAGAEPRLWYAAA
jgi:hypothetical protein